LYLQLKHAAVVKTNIWSYITYIWSVLLAQEQICRSHTANKFSIKSLDFEANKCLVGIIHELGYWKDLVFKDSEINVLFFFNSSHCVTICITYIFEEKNYHLKLKCKIYKSLAHGWYKLLLHQKIQDTSIKLMNIYQKDVEKC